MGLQEYFGQGRRDYAASESKNLAIGRNIIHGATAYSAGLVEWDVLLSVHISWMEDFQMASFILLRISHFLLWAPFQQSV